MSKFITPKYNFHTQSIFRVSCFGPNTSNVSTSCGDNYIPNSVKEYFSTHGQEHMQFTL